MTKLSRSAWVGLISLLVAHGVLSLHAARRLSPTWDEIVYPAAGVAQWHTGAIDLNREHAFLAKLIFALPLLPLQPTVPFSSEAWQAKDAHRFGYLFMFHNRLEAQKLIFWSRFPAVLFSLLTGALLFYWIYSIWGTAGGVLGLVCYISTPILLSRASLAHMEMPMYFFILLSLWLHARGTQERGASFLYGSGIAMGLAFLCKLPALPLLPTFLVLELWEHRPDWRKGGGNFLKLCLAAAGVIVMAYLPWQGAAAAFKETFVNLFLFNRILPYYWHGQTLTLAQAPWVLSWAAWLIKAPLAVLLLGMGGAWLWKCQPKGKTAWNHLVVFAGACILAVLFFGSAVTSVQFSPAYLAIAGLAGGLAVGLKKQPAWRRFGVLGIAALALADAYRIHPNYLAYFNSLVGGPDQGYRWLSDSDQDWGQSLPALAAYWNKVDRPRLLLAYSGAGDPRAYGLVYQDLYSPALVSREYQGEFLPGDGKPLYLAVATKVLQSEPEIFQWLGEHLEPLTIVSSSFFIYDVTTHPDALRWIGHVYAATRRPKLAAWSFKQAIRLDPGHADDQKKLSLLQSLTS